MRRNDVASTSFRRHVPTRFLINQCQIITFFILKSDNIENSREWKGIVLQVPSNQIKGYVGPPSHIVRGGGAVHVHICFYKTGIKAADCQILF